MSERSDLSQYPLCSIVCAINLSPLKASRIIHGGWRNTFTKPVVSKAESDEKYIPPKSVTEENDEDIPAESLTHGSDEDIHRKGLANESDEEYIPPKNITDESDEEYIPPKRLTDESDEEYMPPKSHAGNQNNHLSEYEKLLMKNREEKRAFFEQLKINEAKESFYEAVKSTKPKRKMSIKRFKPPLPSAPQRKSLRLANITPDLSEEALAARAIANAMKETQEAIPPLLLFKDALEVKEDYSYFINDIAGLDRIKSERYKGYASHFKKMKLLDSHIAKVVYNRITALAVHPVQDKIFISAASKNGYIGFWNVNSNSDPYVFRPHLEGITNLQFNCEQTNLVVSSSYDGTLRCGDLEAKYFDEVFNVSDETCCTYFDFLSSTTFLVAQKNGNVSVVDNRNKRRTCEKKHRCHKYAVKSVCVHPVNKSYFITAENTGNIRLWDLRKLQKQPVVDVYHHKRVVSAALFSPVTGNSVLTTSADNSICIFDSSNLGKSVQFQQHTKHNNYTGRWLTSFRATWLPNTDNMFVVGSMLYPRRIEIYDDKMENIHNFVDENLNCITSVNVFHPSLPVLAAANSSGKVFVFTDGV